MRSVTKDDAQVFAVTYKGKVSLLQKLQGAFATFAASIGFGSNLH